MIKFIVWPNGGLKVWDSIWREVELFSDWMLCSNIQTSISHPVISGIFRHNIFASITSSIHTLNESHSG